MSYELSIFAPAGLPVPMLLHLVGESAGLQVLENQEAENGRPGYLCVGRGARKDYCFTVEGPFTVEVEDLPEDVTGAVVGAKVLYQLLVEGSSETAIPQTTRFARKLTKTLGGVLVNEQTSELWPTKSQRTPPRPQREAKVDIVDMRWYFLADDRPENLAEPYLRLARKYLPEALPRRFGPYEPLQGNLERDSDAAFVDVCVQNPFDLIFMVGTYPAGLCLLYQPLSHRIPNWGATLPPVGFVAVRMDRSVLHTSAWREAAEKFFTAFAEGSGSFFASAEVLRNHIRKTQGFGMDLASEEYWTPDYHARWTGLPPYPRWWTWADESYAEILTPYLHGRIKRFGEALFHSWTEQPVDRDQITRLLPDPTQPWIPSRYSPAYADGRFAIEAAEIPNPLYDGPVIPR